MVKRHNILKSPDIQVFFYHLSLILSLTLVYGFIYSLLPKEEFGFVDDLDPYYYSFGTISTVGFGDLTPKTRRAKILTISQQILTLADLRVFLTI